MNFKGRPVFMCGFSLRHARTIIDEHRRDDGLRVSTDIEGRRWKPRFCSSWGFFLFRCQSIALTVSCFWGWLQLAWHPRRIKLMQGSVGDSDLRRFSLICCLRQRCTGAPYVHEKFGVSYPERHCVCAMCG